MKNKSKILSPARVVAGYVGFNVFLVGIIMFACLSMLLFFPEESSNAKYFIAPAIPAMIGGLYLFLPILKKDKADLDKNHDYLIVTLSWIIAIIICAVPYFLTGEFSFTESIFESTSGLTTTGVTVMNPDTLPKIFLFYRSITAYLGGVGMILIMTSLFATTFGMRLYTAEGHQNNLIPNVIKSARLIVGIYTGYIVMGTVMYAIYGMPLFDAVNHSISAVANCGFSTKSASIGYYNSLPIEIITMVLSVLGGTNFLLNLMIIKGNFKAYFKHCETKTMFILWCIFVPILASVLMGTVCVGAGESFRLALFHIISAMSTSGFQTGSSVIIWPSAAKFILILFMIIGFQAGSTAGGLKLYRVTIAIKSVYYDIKSKLKRKREIIPKKINIYGEEKNLTDEIILEEHNFTLIYFTLIFAGTLIFMMQGHSFENALFDFSAMLGCAGVTTGIVGLGASTFSNWIGIIAMLIGRLDIYPFILAILVLIKDMKNLIVKGKKKNV